MVETVAIAVFVGLLIPFLLWVSTTLVKILQIVSASDVVKDLHINTLADHEARLRILENHKQ